MLDDIQLNIFNGDRLVVDSENTGPFARSGAEKPGKFRKIIRLMKSINRLPPTIFINQIVPIGDQISERTSLMAKRNPAIHTTSPLISQIFLRKFFVNFLIIVDS